jgi:hypothetical protein
MALGPADARPLSARIKVLADRFEAQAVGMRKQMGDMDARASNIERDAAWLREAYEALRAAGR